MAKKKRALTIKKRLFISNILMLIIPIMLTFLIVGVFILAYMNISGVGNWDSLTARNNFNQAVYQANTLTERWTSDTETSDIRKDINSFHKNAMSGASLYVYIDNQPLFLDLAISDSGLLASSLSQQNGTILIDSTAAIYCKQIGEYRLILIDINYTIDSLHDGVENINYGIFIFVFVILAVMFTSWLLTKFVFGGIMNPLNILIKGVHEIRDGNLSYRISYEGKDEFAGICEDFNEMARQLSESVQRRQKDETNRKELIAGISHDLRTPLTSIKAYVEGIEKGVASTPQIQKKYLNTIKTKTNELEQTINQLFTFSKLDIGEFPFHLEKVNIIEALSDYINTISPEYENNGLYINFLKSNEKIYVKLDIVQFHNIVTNVLDNSTKYKTTEKGRIDIDYKKERDNIIIELKDDGEGVPEEMLDKLFNVFYRCDPSRNNKTSGSGLGLAITAKILERLGGTIYAKNAKEGGLIIIITLPIVGE